MRRPRLAYIDWLRGVAVLCMILWHTLDAWTLPSDRTGSFWYVVVILGGWAAPLFLFLAGVSVALAGSSRLEAGAHDRRTIAWRLQKRGWQIFALAHLFRLQSFLLTLTASWSSLFKPDILNVLGLGLAAAAFCWERATTRGRQIAWLLAPALAIILITPYSRIWAWPALLRPYAPRLEAYIRPVPGIGVFSIFPWVGLIFAGVFVGALIADALAKGEIAVQKRLVAVGVATGVAGGVGSMLPSFTPSEFWTTSLSYFLIRVSLMTLGMTAGWLWLRGRTPAFSPMLIFGRSSLFVYWVHVEIVYGSVSIPWHRALPVSQSVPALIVFTAAMVGVTHLWSHRRRPLVPDYLKADAVPSEFPGAGFA